MRTRWSDSISGRARTEVRALPLARRPFLTLDERKGVTLLDFDRGGVRVRTLGAPAEWIAPESLILDSALDRTPPVG